MRESIRFNAGAFRLLALMGSRCLWLRYMIGRAGLIVHQASTLRSLRRANSDHLAFDRGFASSKKRLLVTGIAADGVTVMEGFHGGGTVSPEVSPDDKDLRAVTRRGTSRTRVEIFGPERCSVRTLEQKQAIVAASLGSERHPGLLLPGQHKSVESMAARKEPAQSLLVAGIVSRKLSSIERASTRSGMQKPSVNQS
jgi:hypothetical protein